MPCIVKKCNCESKFQDEAYGKSNRLFNLNEKGNKSTCTVCGKKD
jgi:hypothetical protein